MRNLLTLAGLALLLYLVWSLLSGGLTLFQSVFGLEGKTMNVVAVVGVLAIFVLDYRDRFHTRDGGNG